MLVQIGQRQRSNDVVDLLDECHGRIRRFLELATRLATSRDADAATVSDTAAQIRRYFAEAFPLHLADEDELVLPQLFGRSEAVDDALARMHAEHGEHAALVAEMVALCGALQADPRPRGLRRAARRLAPALREVLEPHLALEESAIFPALRALPDAQRASIKQGMQERRAVALANGAQSLRG